MAVPTPGVWGIDLGQCGLKAIRLENIDGEITATAFDYIEHPKILSQPDADPDQLTREALEKFLSRNSLKGDIVAISIPGQSGLARFVKLPPVEEKKIVDIVRFEAKQQIPFPLEEVVWDFQKLGSGVVTDGYALETEIGLFAIKRDMVNRYLQHFKDVNVEVHIVQMAPLALCNFVAYDLLEKSPAGSEGGDEEESGKKSCVVALDIGTDSSNLVVTDGERVIWQRGVPLGGNHFTRALTKDLKLTFAKAEHTKRNAAKSPELKKILLALKPVLNDFVGEVQRSLGFFTTTHRDASIQYLIGLGNAFRLPGLQKFLQEKLQLEVRKLGKLQRVGGEGVLGAPQFKENVLSFAGAYGLALQGLKLTRLHTNLLPQEIQRERLVRAKKPWAAAAAACLFLAAAGLTFGRSAQYKAVKNSGKDPTPVKNAIKEANDIYDRGKKIESALVSEETNFREADQAVKRIAAGIEERFNWNLMIKYVHDSLPLPDGSHLSRDTRSHFNAYANYFEPKGDKAFKGLRERRLAIAEGRPARAGDDQLDEDIKKELVQINIEGIDSLYASDPVMSAYFDRAKEWMSRMSDSERKSFERKEGESTTFPKNGWLVEIRGFTYHWDSVQFIRNTLVENLAVPLKAGNKLSPDMEKLVAKRISHVWVYKWSDPPVADPEPGIFGLISQSYLRDVLGGAAVTGGPVGRPPQGATPPAQADPTATGASRGLTDAWHPLGDIAAATFGSAKTGAGGRPAAPANPTGDQSGAARSTIRRAPRTEFVILFVWQEPLPEGPVAAQ
jgi:type IV pilus assembly protein PilM